MMGAIFFDMLTRTVARKGCRESLNSSAPYWHKHKIKVADWRQWKNIKSHEDLFI